MPCDTKPVTHGDTVHTRTVQRFVWTLSSYKPRQYVPKHDHDRRGLTYLVGGSMQEGFSSRTFDGLAGQVIAKPPDAAHWDRAGSQGAMCLVLEVAHDAATSLHVAPILDRLALCRVSSASGYASHVVRHLSKPRADSTLSLANLAVEFLAIVQAGQVQIQLTPNWLGRVCEFIHDQFYNISTVDEIAAVAGVHPVHLARVFRAHFGCTVRTYLMRLRIEAAASQLRYSRDPVSHIALRLGFADQSHLTRCFSMHFGVSPAQYRRTVQGGGQNWNSEMFG